MPVQHDQLTTEEEDPTPPTAPLLALASINNVEPSPIVNPSPHHQHHRRYGSATPKHERTYSYTNPEFISSARSRASSSTIAIDPDLLQYNEHVEAEQRESLKRRIKETQYRRCKICCAVVCLLTCCIVMLPALVVLVMVSIVSVRCVFFREMHTALVRHYNTTAVSNLVISSVAGNVRISSSPLVSNVTLRVSRNSLNLLSEIRTEISHVSTTLSITLAFHASYLLGCSRTDIDIIFPMDAKVLDRLFVFTDFGNIHLERLAARVTNLDTKEGNIIVHEYRIPRSISFPQSSVSLETINGDIVLSNMDLQDQPFADVQLKTLAGNFRVENISLYVERVNSTDKGLDIGSRWLQFEAVKGNVQLDHFMSGSIQGHSVNGNVNLVLSSSFWGSLDLRLSNFDKQIRISDPLQKMGQRIHLLSDEKHDVRGTIDPPEHGTPFAKAQLLQYVAHDGDITVEFE